MFTRRLISSFLILSTDSGLSCSFSETSFHSGKAELGCIRYTAFMIYSCMSIVFIGGHADYFTPMHIYIQMKVGKIPVQPLNTWFSHPPCSHLP